MRTVHVCNNSDSSDCYQHKRHKLFFLQQNVITLSQNTAKTPGVLNTEI